MVLLLPPYIGYTNYMIYILTLYITDILMILIRFYSVINIFDKKIILAQHNTTGQQVIFKVLQKSAGCLVDYQGLKHSGIETCIQCVPFLCLFCFGSGSGRITFFMCAFPKNIYFFKRNYFFCLIHMNYKLINDDKKK